MNMQIILSRRNLLAMLHKLEMPGSSRTIVKPVLGGNVCISVETDKEHYEDRKRGPGLMHPETEAFISEVGAILDARKFRTFGC